MPELPEVEEARMMIAKAVTGYVITEVDTVDDSIVYDGVTPKQFSDELVGRTVTGCERKGKLVMKFKSPSGDDTQELTFIDVRRLGRLRLVPDPVPSHPPVSELGYDPVQNQPTLEEVLYQARVHPMCHVPDLTDVQVADIHRLLREICVKALDVDGDWKRFPTNWLFFYRWDRGKKKTHKKETKTEHEQGHVPSDEDHDHNTDEGPKIPESLMLDGKPVTVAWVTVGGRSSAYVPAVQKMPSHGGKKHKDENDSELSDASYEEKPHHKKAKASHGKQAKVASSASEDKEDTKPAGNSHVEDVKSTYNLRTERAARRESRK
ncbi:hypothetical protein CspeluHIS016_0802300 [Cutaneotrichosporon spelunceum]|uniref:DNA-formamidopyrimidine glycosylase n=1 Tax=Cutaneotrichosporon spelunceum TaxID=1672016 RepID=A0AAD3TZ95_9TREE|nr:hypothetical protein CspeluHIS016_0802300 [Cutaneotrichosporon spelunceum]